MMNRASLLSRALAIALPIAVGACMTDVEPDPELAEVEDPLASSVSGIGPESGIDWSIDAPWRMEPLLLGGGQRAYDPIPITLTFHDADMQTPGEELRMVEFCGVDVLELQPGETWTSARQTTIPVEDFHEIEATVRWTAQGILKPVGPGEPQHVVRRIWNGESPADALSIDDWAEWHATFAYQPEAAPVGDELRLIVLARIARYGDCAEPLGLNKFQIMYQLKQGKASQYPDLDGPLHEALDSYLFGDFLRVEYPADPLPRFGDGWVYGDVHYHSQATDNEGESALSFRASLAAMKAMGLDYAFATDHTSGGTQVSGTGILGIDNPPDLPWWLDWSDWVNQKYREIIAMIEVPIIERDALRDMNLEKFRTLRAWLNDAGGANAQVLALGGSLRAPQMFLGGEVDVIPEMSNAEANVHGFRYGDGEFYDVFEPCYSVLDILEVYTNWEEICEAQMMTYGSAYGRTAIRDVQGPLDIGYFSRQHLLHLPTDPTNDEQAIIANTTAWGGATLSLKDVVEQHLGAEQKGYAFLAHPVDASSGDGALRLGPDMVPYSEAQLEVAFASPHILGLELWNGNNRVTSTSPDHRPEGIGGAHNFPFLDKVGIEDPEIPGYIQSATLNWNWEALTSGNLVAGIHDGLAMWDQVNLWGITPSRTAGIGWLGGGYRKMFMSGGSDAHGDLNYRRNGRILGVFYATDTVIGAPRNLTYVGDARPGLVDDGGAGQPTIGQAQIVEALRSGRFSVTDGPALRIAIDQNGNNVIDDTDAQMGEDFTLGVGQAAPVLVEWKSTPEFGPVHTVDLVVGAQAGTREGRVYGPRSTFFGQPECYDTGYPLLDPEGNEYCPLSQNRVADDSLHFAVDPAQGMGGTLRFDLDPRDFKVFDVVCWYTEVPAPVEDGQPPSTTYVKHCRVDRTEAASRLFVRAFAQTDDTIDLHNADRFAFTNPIWLHAPELPSPPTVTLSHTQCFNEQNSFSTTATQTGTVPGTLQRQYRVGLGAWSTLSSSTFSAPAGQTVWVRARTCNADGCSGYAMTSGEGADSCPPPIPSPPKVYLEYTGCSYGINSFAATVAAQGSVPATSIQKQYKIATGSWTTLTSSKITAGSQKTVYLRARSCNQYGCSTYAQTSKAGPYCGTGGGPLPQ